MWVCGISKTLVGPYIRVGARVGLDLHERALCHFYTLHLVNHLLLGPELPVALFADTVEDKNEQGE